MILALTAVALAKDPPAPRDMYGNGTTVALVGAIATPVAVVALNTDDAGAQIAGFVAGLAGPPMLAFGSARAARGVTEMGVDVAPVGSVLCGVGWVGANVLSLTGDPVVPAIVFGAGWLAGIGQVVANGVAYGRTDHDYRSSAPPRPTFRVDLDPDRPGLVLSGTF